MATSNWGRYRRSGPGDLRNLESINVVDVDEDVDAQARQYIVTRPPGWWQMRDRRWIPISRMSDIHLNNSIRMIESRGRDTDLYRELLAERERRIRQTRALEEIQRREEDLSREMQRRRDSEEDAARRWQTESQGMLNDLISHNMQNLATPEPPMPNRTRRIKS